MPVQADTIEILMSGRQRLRFRCVGGVWQVAVYRAANTIPFEWSWFQGSSTSAAMAVAQAYGRTGPGKKDIDMAQYLVGRWKEWD